MRMGGRFRSGWGAVLLGLMALMACERGSPAPTRSVTVYCSADSDCAKPLFEAFTKRTGIVVLPVFDTEATKTTGLVNRLLNEKDHPRADVWWSSEPFGTIRLARAGVLEAYTSASAEAAMAGGEAGGWPRELRGKDGMWYGWASRARVIVVNTGLVAEGDRPRSIDDLLKERFKGRVGMARPQFGTTRGHMGALLIGFRGREGSEGGGDRAFRALLSRFKEHGVRLFDGNASVVRAVATGEIVVGLTDTDDVYAGQREGWPVTMIAPEGQTLLLPNTLAKVRREAGGGGAKFAEELIDFLLSVEAQRMLAASDSHNLPVDPGLGSEFAKYAIPSPQRVDLEATADAIGRAMEICGEVLGE